MLLGWRRNRRESEGERKNVQDKDCFSYTVRLIWDSWVSCVPGQASEGIADVGGNQPITQETMKDGGVNETHGDRLWHLRKYFKDPRY